MTPTRAALALASAVLVSALFVSRHNLYTVIVRFANFLAEIAWRWIIVYLRRMLSVVLEWFEWAVPLQVYAFLVWSGCVTEEQYSADFFCNFFYTVLLASGALFAYVAAPPGWLFWRIAHDGKAKLRMWPFVIASISLLFLTFSIVNTLRERKYDRSATMVGFFAVVEIIVGTLTVWKRFCDEVGEYFQDLFDESDKPAVETVRARRRL